MRKLTPYQQKKFNNGICITPYCLKSHQPDCSICFSCEKQNYRKKNPLKYAYQVLKNNAKRRKKDFSLTFEEFKLFAEKNDYMNKKGTRSKSFQIDRIDESRGYHVNNIQCITLKENIYKFRKSKKIDFTEVPF